MLKKIVFAVLLIASMVLSACGGGAAPAATTAPVATNPPKVEATTAQKATTAPASKYSQSPMLDELVKSGKLPSVEKRLPDEPFVVGPGTYMTKEQQPDWQPGIYGGTLHMATPLSGFDADVFVAMNEPLLTAPKIGVQGIQGNVVKSFKVENNNQDFTFVMMKGLKWSDGEPVTSEDVRFTWEDIYGNEKLSPSGVAQEFRNGYAADGDPGKLTIVDDYTFKIQFGKPYGGFLRNLTIEGWKGYTIILNPSHYLKAFHIKYTTLDKMAADLTALNLKDEWWQVFSNKRCQNWDMTAVRCADYPGLYPWIVKKTGSPNTLAWERNPYYSKVDTKGQQLPYIDKIASVIYNDPAMTNQAIMAGNVDYMESESAALVMMPLYKQNEAKGGFHVVLMETHVDLGAIMINQTFDDPNDAKGSKNFRTMVQDLRFRQAVSLAQNRQEMIDNVYYTYAAFPDELVTPEFVKYDVDKANKLLDAMGLTQKDADGFRLYPDGSAMSIILANGQEDAGFTALAELVGANLKRVGIKVTVKTMDPNLRGEQTAANLIQMFVMWNHDRGWDNDVTDPGRGGVLWGTWVSSRGKAGEEPPDWIKKAVDINTRRWTAVSGSDEYNAIVKEGLNWTATNLPYINLVEHVKSPVIVNNKLKNIGGNGAPVMDIASNFSIAQAYFVP
jgi:peptide/nickel transport system substrate-binding protein